MRVLGHEQIVAYEHAFDNTTKPLDKVIDKRFGDGIVAGRWVELPGIEPGKNTVKTLVTWGNDELEHAAARLGTCGNADAS